MNTFVLVALVGFLFASAYSLPLDNAIEENESDSVGEYGNYVEGDMILTDEQMDTLYSPARNGLKSTLEHWPNKTLYYQLSQEHSQEQRDFIELALRKMESVSCIKFVRRTNQKSYVQITADHGGCVSAVGYRHGKQTLNLENYPIGTGCFRQGTIMHEFLHALGFYHMQSAHDRDDYVTINWTNMSPKSKSNFIKYPSYVVSHFGTTYDYDSVMHYSAYAFSITGLPTVEPRDKSKLETIGQREGMSEKDIYKLNAMYKCDAELEKF